MDNKVPEHIQQIMDGFDRVERHTSSSVPASDKTPGVRVFQRKLELEGRQSNPDIPPAPILQESQAMIEARLAADRHRLRGVQFEQGKHRIKVDTE